MAIAGVAESIKELLDHEWTLDYSPTFEVLNAAGVKPDLTNLVSLFLYRVQVDPSRRYIELVADKEPEQDEQMRQPTPSKEPWLALNLRFLLTVWSDGADTEQEMLQECIEILERHAILSGRLLHQDYDWHDSVELKVSIDTLSTEDLMRVWDSLDAPYRLSVPYLVRTVPVGGGKRREDKLVASRTVASMPMKK